MNPECRREVEIEIPAGEMERESAAILKRYRREARIPGFRPGKVPESVIRARFGESIRKDVLDELMTRHFRQAVEPQGLVPVSRPQVVDLKMHEGEPVRFKAEFEVLPPFEVAGYQDVRIQKPDAELTEEEFQAELTRLKEQNAVMEPLPDDHVLADGDYAQITFKGYFPREEPVAAGEEQPHDLHGDNVLIEVGGPDTVQAFTDALRGSTAGQHLTLEVTYPEEFQERRLAGKSVRYEIEVTGAKKKTLSDLEPENVKQYGEFENMDDFYRDLRADMQRVKQSRAANQSREMLSEALGRRFAFPVPEAILSQQVDTRLERGLRALASQGMKAEDMRKMDFERVREAQREPALLEVRAAFVLDKIADQEGIQASDEDLERELTIAAIQEREPIEKLRARLSEDGSLQRIREQMRRDKTAQHLLDRM